MCLQESGWSEECGHPSSGDHSDHSLAIAAIQRPVQPVLYNRCQVVPVVVRGAAADGAARLLAPLSLSCCWPGWAGLGWAGLGPGRELENFTLKSAGCLGWAGWLAG